jgi:hypothetical protein
MGLYSKKLNIKKPNGIIQTANLYTDKADVGSNYLIFKDNGNTVYSILDINGDVDFNVNKSGNVFKVNSTKTNFKVKGGKAILYSEQGIVEYKIDKNEKLLIDNHQQFRLIARQWYSKELSDSIDLTDWIFIEPKVGFLFDIRVENFYVVVKVFNAKKVKLADFGYDLQPFSTQTIAETIEIKLQ